MNDADNVYYLDDDLDSAMNTVDEAKIPSDEEYGKMLTEDKDDVEDEMFDKYLNAELMIDCGGETVRGTVVKRAKNDAGDPIGRRHANPKMDTREYEVEFIDGTTERYSANIVAENIYSQCNLEGNQYLVLKEIVDHKAMSRLYASATDILLDEMVTYIRRLQLEVGSCCVSGRMVPQSGSH